MVFEPRIIVSPCKLVEGFFAYLVQFLLAGVAFTGLVVKLQLERSNTKVQPRALKEWGMDVLKQACAAVFSHFCNILFSILLSHIKLDTRVPPDECAWYFINFMVDSLIGVFFIWVFLKAFESVAARLRWSSVAESET